jgi:hypothetical protein
VLAGWLGIGIGSRRFFSARSMKRIAVDLPGDDESMGLSDYAEIVIRAIGERPNVVLVTQSLGGFTAPLVCAQKSMRALIFVNAMIPHRTRPLGDGGGTQGPSKRA